MLLVVLQKGPLREAENHFFVFLTIDRKEMQVEERHRA